MHHRRRSCTAKPPIIMKNITEFQKTIVLANVLASCPVGKQIAELYRNHEILQRRETFDDCSHITSTNLKRISDEISGEYKKRKERLEMFADKHNYRLYKNR